MLSNARKAVLYDRAATEVRKGWTKKALLREDGSVCLVGAVRRVAADRDESLEIQKDLADELYRTSPVIRALADRGTNPSLYEEGVDGGVQAVEFWNDSPWRRRSQVVRLLERQRDIHADLARLDRADELEAVIRGLRARVAILEARVVELEAKNARLEVENGLLRALRSKYTAKQLVASSSELADLDAQLDAAAAELAGLYT